MADRNQGARGRAAADRTRTVTAAAGRRVRAGLSWLRARPRLLLSLGLAAAAVVAFAAGLFIGSWKVVCRDCPSIAQIYVWEPMQATKILDRDGKLIAELFRERRTPVRIEDLPPHVPQAFIAIEDKRFWKHDGFDFRRLITANLRNIVKGRVTGGGSTITQQLARNMFSEEIGSERVISRGAISRKLKEAKVARELEQVYPKERILEAYINQVNYSDRAWYGIETAAQNYFGKPAVRLDPAEAALLAAVINRPTTYSPFRNPNLALRRRNLVLDLMADQGYLTEEDAARWQATALPQEPQAYAQTDIAPYFVEWVRGILDDRFGADLYSKGLRVITTLDLEMQAAAQAAMDSGWIAIERAPGYRSPKYDDVIADKARVPGSQTPYVQGMFIALEPQTGEVRALIGGRDFRDSKFNRATQAVRQAGSVFKPFVYTAAVESGIPASHVIYDAPLMLEQPDGSIYSPRNYDPEFRGPLTLRDALKHSVNTVAVQLGLDVGLGTVVQTATRMGIRTEVPPYPSTSIGAASVVPLQIAEAYTAFAAGGTKARPRSILRVEDADGRMLWQTNPEREEVLDPMVAAVVRDLLRTAIDGTGYNVRNPALGNLPYEVPAAGKTGTTNDATNVWFVGFTPNLLAAVWFGFDMPKTIVGRATGGTYGAPVFGRFMRSVYYGDDPQLDIPAPWSWPEGMTTREIDRQTGKLAAFWCSENTYQEFFIPGTEPTETCEPRGGLFGQPLRRLPGDTATADTLRGRRRRF